MRRSSPSPPPPTAGSAAWPCRTPPLPGMGPAGRPGGSGVAIPLGRGACGATAAAAGATYWRLQVRRENDPVVRAEQMLVAKAPLAALAELDKLSDTPRSRSAQVQVVRGKAEHQLGQLGMAFADFAAALDADASVADPHVIRALVDDLESEAFPLQWRPALVRILGERVGSPAAEPLRSIVRSQRSRARREALEALELMGQATDDDRLALATAELSDKTAACPAGLNAIRVLVVAGTERAHAL